MTEAVASVVLEMSREQAWRRLRDLSTAHEYVPGIARTEIRSEQAEGVGASRRVYREKGGSLDETVLEWWPGNGFLIQLHRDGQGAPMPFSEATFRYWLEDEPGAAAPGHCRITLTLDYQLRWGALGRLLDRLLLARAIHSNQGRIARRLKRYYEGG